MTSDGDSHVVDKMADETDFTTYALVATDAQITCSKFPLRCSDCMDNSGGNE